MDDADDVLPSSALEGIDLPQATLEALTTRGVPRELRLPDWPGPTLFTSEIGGGRLVSTTEPDALVSRAGALAGYVIGSVRETQGESRTTFSVFALRRGSGEVHLLDALNPAIDRFVSSSLTAFVASLDAFQTAWPLIVGDTPAREAMIGSFRALLLKIDPRSLEDHEHYWPGWLEELE